MARRQGGSRDRRLLLGEVVTVTKAGYAVVKLHDKNMRVRLGARVVDANGAEVGKLVDLIGNVEEPYAVVKVSRPDGSLLGSQVFMIIAARKGRPRRRPRGPEKRGAGRPGGGRQGGRRKGAPRGRRGPRRVSSRKDNRRSKARR